MEKINLKMVSHIELLVKSPFCTHLSEKDLEREKASCVRA